MGPACWSHDKLVALINAGCNVARFNFSHGSHEDHERTLWALRTAAEVCGKTVATMLDTKGPEIRTGFLENGKSVELVEGAQVEIVTDYDFKGNASKFACSYPSLAQDVKVGTKILVADGTLTMRVLELKPASVVCVMLNSGTLSERKNMNLPGVKVNLPTISDKDRVDLRDFAAKHKMDFVAASFVRKGSDIDAIREALGERGKRIQIIAKIENQEGLENFNDIFQKADGVMVARGDLGMEIPPEKVFLAQKMLIRRANVLGKTVITATQMLESMIVNPRPTRAECTDVANAVLDGTDCVMLSGESAMGLWPIQAVETMSSICIEAESAINHAKLYLATRNSVMQDNHGHALNTAESIASSAVKTVHDIKAKMIVVLSETGATARLVSKFRPPCPFLVVTMSSEVARQCEGVLRGCTTEVLGSMMGTDSILIRAAVIGKERGWVKPGDFLVAIHGMSEGSPGNSNMLKVLVVPE
ncbi:pyruvate kinase [Batrachochytrium salamandrivorans]|nr:pyruvate kinase [Batrachochytrium salamandrivorans]